MSSCMNVFKFILMRYHWKHSDQLVLNRLSFPGNNPIKTEFEETSNYDLYVCIPPRKEFKYSKCAESPTENCNNTAKIHGQYRGI